LLLFLVVEHRCSSAEDRWSTGVGGRHANGPRTGGDVHSAFFRTGSEDVTIYVQARPPFAGVEVEVGEPKVAWGRSWRWSVALARGGRCPERQRFGEEVPGGAVRDVVAGVGVVLAEELVAVEGVVVVAVAVEAVHGACCATKSPGSARVRGGSAPTAGGSGGGSSNGAAKRRGKRGRGRAAAAR